MVDEMMRVTTSFLRGEVTASNDERKKSFPPWKQQKGNHKQNFMKGYFRNQPRSERKHDRFTLLTKTPKEIFTLDKGKFKAPLPMTTLAEKRNHAKFCEFHGEVGHNTDECMHLKKQIEEMPKAGKLSHLIKELKRNNEKEQPKAEKKGEASGKDKALAILMVQSWERVARQKDHTKLFSQLRNFFSTPREDEGTEGPMIIEAEIGGQCIHCISQKAASSSVNSSQNAKTPGRRRSHYSKEQQDDLAGMYDGLRIKRKPSDCQENSRRKNQEDEIFRDIEETFKTLRKINMKLNPKKCTFGAEERTFLGYKVSTIGLKVCPNKVDDVLSLPSLKCLKDVHKLNGKLARLNRFLSKSAEKLLPLFRTLKKCMKKSDFHWTTEAEEAFKQIKQLIAKLPMLVALMEKEKLIIYLAATKETVLVEELKEKSISKVKVLAVVEEEGDTWMTPIFEYLTEETLPADVKQARAVRRKSHQFAIINGTLYKKIFPRTMATMCRPTSSKLCIDRNT
nr:reverse transcriptase domain-containing protein [Tanacetum cinerariifolium]